MFGVSLWLGPPAGAADARVTFEQAVRYDLGGEGSAALAFSAYRRAAQAGLPEAEFNVGVMLDSGRGVAPDLAQAATWYARAALHGNRRAAYNLGQLYENGEGVPRNADLARAWFAVSDLAAARARLAALRAQAPAGAPLAAPSGTAPEAGAADLVNGGVELVWTSPPQPEPVRFFVEVRALDAAGSREVFSGFADTSAVLATLPDKHGAYAWRVAAIARAAGRYVASEWRRFTLAPPESASE